MRKNLASFAFAALGLLSLASHAGQLQVTVVDKEGKPVPDAVVVLRPFSGAPPKVALPMHATINQQKMRFVPAVSLVAVGAKGTFINNDPWEHHVRGSAAGVLNFDADTSGGFEMRLDGKPDNKPAKQAEIVFSKAGPILLGCHLHASMKGFVYVSDSPWAEITPESGVASFDDVPSGPVFVRVWHGEQLIDLPPQQMTLSAAPAKATVQLSVVPRRRRV
jgi:plastocyanin